MKKTKLCKVCNKSFEKNYTPAMWARPGVGTYCSVKCHNSSRKGKGFMQGKTHKPETKAKMREAAIKNLKSGKHYIPDWTGKKHKVESRLKMRKDGIDHTKGNYRPGYVALHKKMRKAYEIKNICEHCKTATKTHLANKSGKYLEILGDWIELCPECHYHYDRRNNLLNTYESDLCV